MPLLFQVLNYALTGPDGTDNCSKFVEILGLRSIFPMFMRPPQPAAAPGKKSRRGGRAAMMQLEEHLVSVLGALLRHCSGSAKQRVLSKFVERDHEKADRLLELHFNYQDRLKAADQRLARDPLQRQLMREQPEAAEEELFLRRLEAGLFTLQQVDSLIVQVFAEADYASSKLCVVLFALCCRCVSKARHPSANASSSYWPCEVADHAKSRKMFGISQRIWVRRRMRLAMTLIPSRRDCCIW